MSIARDKGHTEIMKLLQVSWFAVVGDQRGCRVSSLACAFRGELRRSGVTQVAAGQKSVEVEATRMEALRREAEQKAAEVEATRMEALRREQQHAHTAGGAFAVALNVFSVAEVRSATDGFAAARKIGQGGFGAVFSGRLRGAAVAVKQLDRTGLQVRPSTPHLSSSLAQSAPRHCAHCAACDERGCACDGRRWTWKPCPALRESP